MSINGITFKKGSTAITLTGGTDFVMKDDGVEIPGGIHVVDTSEANIAIRPSSTLKSRPANTSTGVKGKREFTHVRPKIRSDLKLSYPLFRGTFEIDAETTAAELLELKLQAVQHIMDSELDDFYNYGSVR